jgi:preprotein translocase subunit SecD
VKIEEKLKVTLVILVIILISLISFGGIYFPKMKGVENMIPDYQLGMDLEGSRLIKLGVDKTKNTVIYDKDGKVVDKEGEGTTKKEEPVNPEDTLTQENYNKVKEIVQKRLDMMNTSDYTIRQNEKTGELYVQIPENANTDLIAQYMAVKGKFTVQNENNEVLLNKSHVKKAEVRYSSGATGTAVYLTIQLNKEGTQIFQDITKTYVISTDDEGKDNSKKITMKIDDSTLLETAFDSEISNGMIQMSIGTATTDSSTLDGYVKEASNITVLLNSGELPLTYEISENRYVMSDLTYEMFYIPVAVIGAVLVIGLIFLMLKYKKNGFLSSIALIGYLAVLLLVLRYTNVMLTMEGMIAIIITVVLDYIFTIYLLNLIKHQDSKTVAEASHVFKEALIKTLFIFIPVAVTAVVLCFAGWLPIYSFGMVAFWGLLLIVLYNLIITRTLVVDTKKA